MTRYFQAALQCGALCALLLNATTACASHRQFVGYCAAPDGTRFVLRAAYAYSHFAIARSPITRQDDWKVYLIDHRKKEREAPVELHFIDPNFIRCDEIG